MQALVQSNRTSRVGRLCHFCNMDIVLFLLHIRGLKPLLLFYLPVEEKFAGGKFRGRKISRNSIRSGYYFRGRKISRKIQIRENSEHSEHLLHAKNWCYTVLCFARIISTLCPNSGRQTARIGGGAAAPCPPSRTPMHGTGEMKSILMITLPS